MVKSKDLGAAFGNRLSSSTETACGLGPSGFDPSRDGLEHIARALWLRAASFEGKEDYWLTMSDYDRESYFNGARAAVAALRETARMGHGSWCAHAARKAQVSKQKIVWALGGTDIHLGDDEVFAACLDAIASRDSDGSPKGGDACGSVEDGSAGRRHRPDTAPDLLKELAEDIASGEAFREQRFAEDDDADYFLRAQRTLQRRAAALLKAQQPVERVSTPGRRSTAPSEEDQLLGSRDHWHSQQGDRS